MHQELGKNPNKLPKIREYLPKIPVSQIFLEPAQNSVSEKSLYLVATYLEACTLKLYKCHFLFGAGVFEWRWRGKDQTN